MIKYKHVTSDRRISCLQHCLAVGAFFFLSAATVKFFFIKKPLKFYSDNIKHSIETFTDLLNARSIKKHIQPLFVWEGIKAWKDPQVLRKSLRTIWKILHQWHAAVWTTLSDPPPAKPNQMNPTNNQGQGCFSGNVVITVVILWIITPVN